MEEPQVIRTIREAESDLFAMDTTPSESRTLLARAEYPGQRTQGANAIAQLRALMLAKRWVPLSLLTITKTKKHLFLLDGQHRLAAHAGITNHTNIRWAVRLLKLESPMLRKCSAAARLILANTRSTEEAAQPVLLVDRDDYVHKHEQAFDGTAKIMAQIEDKTHRQRLYTTAVVAVLVVTVIEHGETALQFWPYAFNQGDKALRTAANAMLKPPPFGAPARYYARIAAQAWNHKIADTDVSHETHGGPDITVAGTGLRLMGWKPKPKPQPQN